MVQNQAHTGGDFPNRSSDPASFTLTFDFSSAADPTLDTTSVLAWDSTSGDATPHALTASGAGAQLVVVLAAGDIFFFKYRNAHPFAQQ